jgi:hypothetical protein
MLPPPPEWFGGAEDPFPPPWCRGKSLGLGTRAAAGPSAGALGERDGGDAELGRPSGWICCLARGLGRQAAAECGRRRRNVGRNPRLGRSASSGGERSHATLR